MNHNDREHFWQTLYSLPGNGRFLYITILLHLKVQEFKAVAKCKIALQKKWQLENITNCRFIYV